MEFQDNMSASLKGLSSLYTIPVQTLEGGITTLEPYRGKILLIVNVASRCGFTSQYAELELLYQTYQAKGVVVLGFPCDQFLHQEPGTDEEIKAFVEQCFRVTFPMFAKIHVRGKKQAPLYAYLSRHIEKKPLNFIPWNFTKLLIDAHGHVLQRYLPMTSFKTIRKAIDNLLLDML